jgi:hypothetical protein
MPTEELQAAITKAMLDGLKSLPDITCPDCIAGLAYRKTRFVLDEESIEIWAASFAETMRKNWPAILAQSRKRPRLN